ncbi:long-chain fatty acid--CoA ligase [Synechococcus sp. PCC 7336]|uniref:AMP-dependent synthetase/ligase n=1 Tax=Synechococcus sp. PCC 7336 TaxID=195250 RepID=UPI00034B456B|nr:AMP-binding protein [Synechococcus sp. PCC 7336]
MSATPFYPNSPCEFEPAVHTRWQGCLDLDAMAVEANLTTLPTLWRELADCYGDRLALRDPHSKPTVELTYRQVYEQAIAFASGLQSLGCSGGERVAIVAENSPRWLIADIGTAMAGLANAPRSSAADARELAYILQHSDSRIAIVENAKTWQRLQPELAGTDIEQVILLSDEVVEGCLTFAAVQAKGRSHSFTPPDLSREDLATLIYTSGTTGRPKGVMLTHGNLMHQVEALRQLLPLNAGDRVLSILPTWHAYERAGEYLVLSQGCQVIYTNPRHLKTDLKTEQPHFLVAVPRIWELLYDGIQQQLQRQTGLKQALARTCLAISHRYIVERRIARNESIQHFHISPLRRGWAALQAGLLAPLHQLGDRLIYRTIRQAVAPQLRYAISGGGSLPSHIDTFFEVTGIAVLNGYGLTETAPVLAGRGPSHNVRGTVGRAIAETEIKIVDPETHTPLPAGRVGLVFARGPQVMQGYYNNPEATAKVLSSDGWFNTEDLGWLTPAGDLVLTGRAKDTIVLRNGENIEPVPLEDACSRSPYIDQIVVVGQDQKRLGALIYPNEEAIAAWGQSRGLPAENLLQQAAVRELIASELKQRIRQRPGYRSDDTIADFCLVPEAFSIENGLMTQTLKIKRKQVTERYAEAIASLYEP